MGFKINYTTRMHLGHLHFCVPLSLHSHKICSLLSLDRHEGLSSVDSMYTIFYRKQVYVHVLSPF